MSVSSFLGKSCVRKVSCLARSEKGEVRTGEMYWGVDGEWRKDVRICE
jgi:hypothetical protein